jgi:L-threonylcarbamoyladenylate synthase
MYTEYLGPIAEDSLLSAKELLQKGARLVQRGGLVAIPTETTYGLAASILNETALSNLYGVKGRASSSAVPVQISSLDQVKFIAREIPSLFYLIAEKFFPGPLTVILKKSPYLSSTITAGKDTVGIRLSSNPIVRKMIELVGCPIAMPSANVSGKPSPITAKHVLEDFNGRIEGIIDGGETTFGLESSILSLEDPKKPTLLRLGMITQDEIEKALGMTIYLHPQALLPHYSSEKAPSLPMIRLFSSWDEIKIYLQLSNDSKRLIMSSEDKKSMVRDSLDYFELTEKNLYEGLRTALREGYAEVLVLCSQKVKGYKALHQRLKQIANT